MSRGKAAVQMDIAAMPFTDSSFDIIYCSHILEHVADDQAGMRELGRVLKANGWGVIIVPIAAPVTFEGPSATTPEERLRLFGQVDHVRSYGMDIVTRLEAAGFNVVPIHPASFVSAEDLWRMNLRRDEVIFHCKKATSRASI